MAKSDVRHEALVDKQFGSQATAYLRSNVHAKGADLNALASLMQGQTQARVLDLGCGAGHVSFAVAPHVSSVVAYDLSTKMLETVTEAANERGLGNVRVRQGLAESLPFSDADFDAVLSRYSAHHWRDLDAGLREAIRVLKPGGLLAVVDAISPGTPSLDTHLQAIELLRDPSHVRDYTRAEWDGALARAGFLPGIVTSFRVRLEFAVWTTRMRTPKVQAEAIRALQNAASIEVARHFRLGADGSFDLDTALFRATKRLATA